MRILIYLQKKGLKSIIMIRRSNKHTFSCLVMVGCSFRGLGFWGCDVNKNDFVNTNGMYRAVVNGIEISISENEMSDSVIRFAEKVLNEYPKKIAKIAEHISQEKWISNTYNLTKEEIAEKLHTPAINICEGNGLLSYCENEIDIDHILDVYFLGVFEKLYDVVMDG